MRVLVVDDHRVIAEGLTALIEDTDDLEVVGIAGSARNAIEATARLAPDVILLDHLLPDRTGVEAIGEIKASCPDAAVVMLTSATDDALLAAAFDAGAAGHLLKTEAAGRVLEAMTGTTARAACLSPFPGRQCRPAAARRSTRRRTQCRSAGQDRR